jgi:WD40 repeat protein
MVLAPLPDGSKLITESFEEGSVWRSVPLDGGDPEVLGHLEDEPNLLGQWGIDPAGRRVAKGVGTELYVHRLEELETSRHLVGSHLQEITATVFHPDGDLLFSADAGGEVRVWSLEDESPDPLQIIRTGTEERLGSLDLNAAASKLVAGVPGFGDSVGRVWVWDLAGPPAADPIEMTFHGEGTGGVFNAQFHPSRPWLATGTNGGAAVWPFDRDYPWVLRGMDGAAADVAFDPSGNWLVAVGATTAGMRWSLSGSGTLPGQELWPNFTRFIVSPGSFGGGLGLQLIFPATGEQQPLVGFDGPVWNVAVSPDEKLIAAGGGQGTADEKFVLIWDIDSREPRKLDAGDQAFLAVMDVKFRSNTELIESGVMAEGTRGGLSGVLGVCRRKYNPWPTQDSRPRNSRGQGATGVRERSL